MTPEQKAAFIFAQTASMLAKMEAMKVANEMRAHEGYSPAYGPSDFMNLPMEYGVYHDHVIGLFAE